MGKKLTWGERPSKMFDKPEAMAKLGEADKVKLAHAVMVEAALDLTRMKRPTRRAVMLVLTEQVRPADAARATKQTRQHIHDSLIIARVRLAEVRQHVQPG